MMVLLSLERLVLHGGVLRPIRSFLFCSNLLIFVSETEK